MKKTKFLLAGVLFLPVISSYAQDMGLNQGIDQASTQLQSVFQSVKTFLFILAAIVALYGGFNVYSKYQSQDQDAAKAAAKFGFGFVFLMAAAFIVEAVFIN